MVALGNVPIELAAFPVLKKEGVEIGQKGHGRTVAGRIAQGNVSDPIQQPAYFFFATPFFLGACLRFAK